MPNEMVIEYKKRKERKKEKKKKEKINIVQIVCNFENWNTFL